MKKVIAILLVAVALISGAACVHTSQQAFDVRPAYVADPGGGGRP
ncbi:hypothetical protein ABEV41_00525 [Geobacillus thermodenitrificans]